MKRVAKRLIEEAKKVIRFYLFLRYDIGLTCADKLTIGQLKELMNVYLH